MSRKFPAFSLKLCIYTHAHLPILLSTPTKHYIPTYPEIHLQSHGLSQPGGVLHIIGRTGMWYILGYVPMGLTEFIKIFSKLKTANYHRESHDLHRFSSNHKEIAKNPEKC